MVYAFDAINIYRFGPDKRKRQIFHIIKKNICFLRLLFGIEQCIYVNKSHLKRINTLKKVREFPVSSRVVTTKLSLGGNNDVITELFLPRGSLVSDIPAGDGKLVNLFLR
jgi:hypothetical protein